MVTKERKQDHRNYEHLDDAPIPITICHGERMSIHYANQRALSLFVVGKREYLGNTISEIFPDAFPEEIITKYVRTVLARDKPPRQKTEDSFNRSREI